MKLTFYEGQRSVPTKRVEARPYWAQQGGDKRRREVVYGCFLAIETPSRRKDLGLCACGNYKHSVMVSGVWP